MNRLISEEKAIKLLNNITSTKKSIIYEKEKHRIIFSNNNETESVLLRLPINVSPTDRNIIDIKYIILLIQSGSCSMGYYKNGQNLDHKVFKSYMVRKKQGKSQIKYLKTKGKSRAGSRVRLANTTEFFENINERLQEYFQDNEVDRIAISCSKILIPYLYNSKVKCPFNKKDDRLFKIPKHVETPNHEIMNEINMFLLKGELIYEEQQQDLINKLLDESN